MEQLPVVLDAMLRQARQRQGAPMLGALPPSPDEQIALMQQRGEPGYRGTEGIYAPGEVRGEWGALSEAIDHALGSPLADPRASWQPMSNQLHQTPFSHHTPSGTLQALTTLMSGIGGPMGYQAPQQQQPDPGFFIRSVPDNTGQGGPGSVMAGFKGQGDAVPPDMPLSAFRGGSKLGLTGDGSQHAQWAAAQKAKEQGIQDTISRRAMMQGEARAMRGAGMDQRTAALLSALGQGGGGGIGEDVLGQALLGPQGWAARQNRGIESRKVASEGKLNDAQSDLVRSKIEQPAGTTPAVGGNKDLKIPNTLIQRAAADFDIALPKSGGNPAAAARAVYENIRTLVGDDIAEEAVLRATGQSISAMNNSDKQREDRGSRQKARGYYNEQQNNGGPGYNFEPGAYMPGV